MCIRRAIHFGQALTTQTTTTTSVHNHSLSRCQYPKTFRTSLPACRFRKSIPSTCSCNGTCARSRAYSYTQNQCRASPRARVFVLCHIASRAHFVSSQRRATYQQKTHTRAHSAATPDDTPDDTTVRSQHCSCTHATHATHARSSGSPAHVFFPPCVLPSLNIPQSAPLTPSLTARVCVYVPDKIGVSVVCVFSAELAHTFKINTTHSYSSFGARRQVVDVVVRRKLSRYSYTISPSRAHPTPTRVRRAPIHQYIVKRQHLRNILNSACVF